MTAAALAVSGACVAAGQWASGYLRRREQALTDWADALGRMQAAASHRALTLGELLREGAGAGALTLPALLEQLEAAPAAEPEALMKRLPWHEALLPGEREALERCLTGLFSASLQEQAETLAWARERLEGARQACREKRERDGRLYRSLGWLGGAAVFILLC